MGEAPLLTIQVDTLVDPRRIIMVLLLQLHLLLLMCIDINYLTFVCTFDHHKFYVLLMYNFPL